MLKQRIITASLLVPLVIWGIFALPDISFAGVVGLVVALGAWEWSRLAGIQSVALRSLYTLLVVGLMGLLWRQITGSSQALNILLVIAAIWWLSMLIGLFRYRTRTVTPYSQPVIKGVLGLFILLGTFIALVILRNDARFGVDAVMYLLLLIWIVDSAAYFSGKKWGKHKLLVNVSPGKSWEGVAGAIVATLVLSGAASRFFELSGTEIALFMMLNIVVLVFSIVGDLSESVFKRQLNFKDSSQLLPGHGGILDRIDSLTAAAPLFLAGLVVTGITL